MTDAQDYDDMFDDDSDGFIYVNRRTPVMNLEIKMERESKRHLRIPSDFFEKLEQKRFLKKYFN